MGILGRLDIHVQVLKNGRQLVFVTVDNVLFRKTGVHFLIDGQKMQK